MLDECLDYLITFTSHLELSFNQTELIIIVILAKIAWLPQHGTTRRRTYGLHCPACPVTSLISNAYLLFCCRESACDVVVTLNLSRQLVIDKYLTKKSCLSEECVKYACEMF